MTISLSVITPSFQQGKFIERTIQSVLAQSVFAHSTVPVEYVVCDGGSEDETLTVLRRYENALRWVSECDRGQADAINKGLTLTSGDIIAWINSDDVYYPQAFQRVLDFFEAYPEVSVVYGQADWIDEQDRVIAPYPVQSWNYSQLTKECYLCQPAVFFRRCLVEQFGPLDVQLQYCMDYELWLRYGRQTTFVHLPVRLAGSRLYASNKTFGGRLAAHRETNHMLKRTLGQSTRHWIFEYSRLQTDAAMGEAAVGDARSLGITDWLRFYAIFYWNSMMNCYRFNKKAFPIVLAKLLVYQFSLKPRLSQSAPPFDIAGHILGDRT